MPSDLRAIAAALLLSVSVDAVAAASAAMPYVPPSHTTVLERLPSTSDPRVRQFAVLKSRTLAAPNDAAAAVALARAYVGYGRDTGDARYLGRAQAVIAPLLLRRPPPDDALLVAATIFQSRHQFIESRRLLDGLVQRRPDHAQAWLTLSSVALVQGDMAVGRSACAHLVRSAGVLVTAGCSTAWATVNGHAKDSLATLDRLLALEPAAPPDILAWVHGLQADAARYSGQAARAELEFRNALRYAPGDNFLLADFADFLLDAGRPAEALALVKDYSQSDTSFLRQVLAESALGLPVARAHIATMASRFRDLEQRGDSRLYGREEARFALVLQHDPARALKLAQGNWTIQRAPEDIRIFLESALAAGQPAAARGVLAYIAKTQFEDPRTLALAAKVSAAIATTAPGANPAPVPAGKPAPKALP